MYVPRINQTLIYRSFETGFVTAVLGPRRVGKTTLITHYAEEQADKKWVKLTMDNREDRARIEQSELKACIQEKALQQIGYGEKIWVIIDEAQKCPVLFDQIKLLYDQYKDQNAIKFILTGSGFLSLHQLSAESLAGRIELYYLHEFGLQETLGLKGVALLNDRRLFDIIGEQQDLNKVKELIESREPFKNLIQETISEQLVWGGMPELLQAKEDSMRYTYLGNYLQTYLEKDIRAITSINDLNLYQRLMEIIAEQTGSIRQDKEIVEALGCSRDTLKKYRGFLLATLLYKETYPFIHRPLKRLVKSPKGYLLNNGLISYLTGIQELAILQKTGLIGHRFENWFLKELQIWLDCDVKRSEIYYWRTSSGIEVDFVVEKKPLILPFEVTYSKNIQNKKVKKLIYFLKQEPKATLGFYVYMGDFHYDEQNRICFLPAWGMC